MILMLMQTNPALMPALGRGYLAISQELERLEKRKELEVTDHNKYLISHDLMSHKSWCVISHMVAVCYMSHDSQCVSCNVIASVLYVTW